MTLKQLFPKAMLLIFLAASQLVMAQNRTVTGRVTDDNGAPVVGASVVASGSKKGTTTDANGSFSISFASSVNSITVSSIGFTAKEVEITGKNAVDVTLSTKNTSLTDVVVVGYGSMRKRDLTGSTTTLKEKDLNPGPITNPLQQIAGRAAGVNVTQIGSEPGVAPSVRIRGVSSLAGGNDPLVVVDGVQGDLSLFNQIPPSEIESIDILKDASATAIYGARGNAGVILVTTKRSKSGKSFLEYNTTVSFEQISRKLDMLDAAGWRAQAALRGLTAADKGGNTDWLKEITRNGFTQNHNLAFGGGTSSFNYRASVTAILQDGIVTGASFRNYIGRLNATQRLLNDNLKLEVNLNSSTSRNTWNGPGVVNAAISARPTDPIYKANPDPADRNGPYFRDADVFNYLNPYARAKEIIDGSEANNMFGSMRADLKIWDGLSANWFGSIRRTSSTFGGYQAPRTTIQDAILNKGIGYKGTNNSQELLQDIGLNYKKEIGEHSINADFVYEWQRQVYDGVSASGRGFINDFNTYNNLQASDITKASSGDVSSYKNDRTLVSFLGRVNYSYMNRYMLTASIRRDGSSVFGAKNKWGNFPSFSAAWRASQEEFLSKVKFINDLKVRVGWGITGSQQGLGPQQSLALVGSTGTTFFGGNLIPDFSIIQNANANLKWEQRNMFNAGIDFTVWKNKLSGTVDFYTGTTKDLLFNYFVGVGQFPFPFVYANVGSLKNSGLEVSLNYTAFKNKDWTVNLGGNFSTYKNTVTTLSGTVDVNGIKTNLSTNYVNWGSGGTTGVASTNNGISYLIAGQQIGSFWLYQHAGVDASGTQIIVDRNKDAVIDDGTFQAGGVANRDRYLAGQALPKYVFAFTPSVSYKNFDLSMVWRGAGGNKIYNASRALKSAMGQLGIGNVLKSAPALGINNITYASDLWLEDGAFIRFDNLNIGYRINTAKMKYISSMRVGFTANNLLVITNYSGIDPEINASGGGGTGIDYGIFPRTRNFAFSLNVNFK